MAVQAHAAPCNSTLQEAVYLLRFVAIRWPEDLAVCCTGGWNKVSQKYPIPGMLLLEIDLSQVPGCRDPQLQ